MDPISVLTASRIDWSSSTIEILAPSATLLLSPMFFSRQTTVFRHSQNFRIASGEVI
jgi:hypothetical protein